MPVKLCSFAITLLPKGASAKLKKHEAGHVKIQKHYECELLKSFLQKEIEKEVCAKEFKDKKDLGKEVDKLISQFSKTFGSEKDGLGDLMKWWNKYDDMTGDGQEGSEEDQGKAADKVIEEMNKVAKEKFPSIFP